MTDETAVLSESLRTLAVELFPEKKDRIIFKEFDDDLLILGVHLQRQIDRKIDRLPHGYAEGAEPGRTARSRHEVEAVG